MAVLAGLMLSAQEIRVPVALVQRLKEPVKEVHVMSYVRLDIVQDTADFVVLNDFLLPSEIESRKFPDSLVGMQGGTLTFRKRPQSGELQLHVASLRLRVTSNGSSEVRLKGRTLADTIRFKNLDLASYGWSHLSVASPCVTDSVCVEGRDNSSLHHEYIRFDHGNHKICDYGEHPFLHSLGETAENDFSNQHKEAESPINFRTFFGGGMMFSTGERIHLFNAPIETPNSAIFVAAEEFNFVIKRGKSWNYELGVGFGVNGGGFGKRAVTISSPMYVDFVIDSNPNLADATAVSTTYHYNYFDFPITATWHGAKRSWFSAAIVPKLGVSSAIIQNVSYYDGDAVHTYTQNGWSNRWTCDMRLTYGFRSWRLYTQFSPFSPLKNSVNKYMTASVGVMWSFIE